MKLRVSANGRFFEDQNGTPFFYLGDTAWRLFKQLDHKEVERYFRNRVEKGFTVIQAYVLRGLEVPNIYGDLPLLNGNPKTPNEAFFNNVDFIVDRAGEHGLVMGLVTTFGEHVQRGVNTSERFKKNEEIFDAEKAYAYGRFLGTRYKDKPVVWLFGGDRKPVGSEDVWRAMAGGLNDGSDNSQLISYHGPGDPNTPSSSYWFHNEDWLDFNTIQSGHGWGIANYNYIAYDYNLTPHKPTIDMEPRYEQCPDVKFKSGRRMDAHQEREAGYWAMLAGAAGHGYGCNSIWQFYSEKRTYDYTFRYDIYFADTHWEKAMDFPGAFQMGNMRRLFELRPWYKLIPDQTLIASPQGEGEDHTQAARADDGSFVIAYFTYGSPVSLYMDRLTGRDIKAQWYDPRDGSWLEAGSYTNRGTVEFVPPSSGKQNDWVLVLDDAAKNFWSYR